jgi:hypothetical protein
LFSLFCFCIGDKEKIICTPRLRNNYTTIFFLRKLSNYCSKPQDADYPILNQLTPTPIFSSIKKMRVEEIALANNPREKNA